MAIALFIVLWAFVNVGIAIKNDPRDHFYSHAVVQPSVWVNIGEKRDIQSLFYKGNYVKNHEKEKITVGFEAFGKNFKFDLHMNKDLLPRDYFEKHHENGRFVISNPMQHDDNHCHYQGHLQGVRDSWAAISICNGISGVLYDGSDLYYIQPDDVSNDDASHVVFRASDFKSQNLTCDVSDSLVAPQNFMNSIRVKRAAALHESYKNAENSRFVELILVIDNKEFKKFNEDRLAVFERSKAIANIVNGLYSPLNISIALVGVIIWNERDEIEISSNSELTLSNFIQYRKNLTLEHPNDNAQLITASLFDGEITGKSLLGTICSYGYSAGINVDHSQMVGVIATTVAHQLGHNLGMQHDTLDDCQCPSGNCIMTSTFSNNNTRHWSSCSVEYLRQSNSRGMDYCLRNQPSVVMGPSCGNGILEEGEECDCGMKDFCDSYCCNSSTCKLFENSTCAMGSCCDTDTCQKKVATTLCRRSVSECDLPEYCDGNSEFCPSDTFHTNGMECNNGQAYCFDGKCQSHTDQCKLLWGQTGNMSHSKCYERNVRGNVNGNCGFSWINQTYEACNEEDVLCGRLFCTHENEALEFGMEATSILSRMFLQFQGEIYACMSVIIDFGLSDQDPGLVPNGAKCGNGKVCVNQKCVAVGSIQNITCLQDC